MRPIDVAFSPAVKAAQAARGSREAYARMDMKSRITPELKTWLEAQRSVFLATASAEGQPYVQHRGGPPGFLRVLDEETVAFADFRGNKQFITLGNAGENDKAFLFTVDYRQRRRIKLWGTLDVREGDDALLAELTPEGYRAVPERVVLFRVRAWDVNCPQHIPVRYEADEVDAMLSERDARIADLEARLAQREGRREA